MTVLMKQRYRLYRRQRGVFYVFDNVTGKRESLETEDEATAKRLLHAKNEAQQQPFINRQIARAYLAGGDPEVTRRTWKEVIEEIIKLKHGETQQRWVRASKDQAFDLILNLKVFETQPDHFLRVLERGRVATNVFLRRIHNFALDIGWLPWPVLPKKRWPTVNFKKKRAITWEEHCRIVEREANLERRAFYQLAWYTGASQTDLALLEASQIDWERQALSFTRKKTRTIAILRFDEGIAEVLRSLPQGGPLFPYLRTVRAGDRATEFKQRCDGLEIKGVSLHSYRYAWAQRARKAGYPEPLQWRTWGTIARPCIGPTRAWRKWKFHLWANLSGSALRSQTPSARRWQGRPSARKERRNEMNGAELITPFLHLLDRVIEEYGLELYLLFVYMSIPLLVWILRGGFKPKRRCQNQNNLTIIVIEPTSNPPRIARPPIIRCKEDPISNRGEDPSLAPLRLWITDSCGRIRLRQNFHEPVPCSR
jgi:integrase